jgi:hypothetical protein
VLQDLYAIPGVLETRSLIATETVRQTLQQESTPPIAKL